MWSWTFQWKILEVCWVIRWFRGVFYRGWGLCFMLACSSKCRTKSEWPAAWQDTVWQLLWCAWHLMACGRSISHLQGDYNQNLCTCPRIVSTCVGQLHCGCKVKDDISFRLLPFPAKLHTTSWLTLCTWKRLLMPMGPTDDESCWVCRALSHARLILMNSNSHKDMHLTRSKSLLTLVMKLWSASNP